jgi:hypothetical protein
MLQGALAAGSVAATAFGADQPRAADPLPLVVEVMDGSRGVPLPGATVRFVASVGVARDLVPDGGLHRLADSGLTRGKPAWFRLDVRPPEGFVLDPEEQYPVNPSERPISLFATGLAETVVAWTELRLRVTVVDAEGNPAEGVEIEVERVGDHLSRRGNQSSRRGFRPSGTGRTAEDGSEDIRGVPAIPGDYLQITAWGPGSRVVSDPVAIQDPQAPVALRLTLPPPDDSGFSFGGSCGGAIG